MVPHNLVVLLVARQILGHDLHSLRNAGVAALLLVLLRVYIGVNYLIAVLLVRLELFRNHWSVRDGRLSWLRDHDKQLERDSLRLTLGESEPSRETEDLVRFSDEERFLGVSSAVDVLLDLLNRRVVVALARCLLGLSVDNVLSLLKVGYELIKFDELMPVLRDADGFALVVVFRS